MDGTGKTPCAMDVRDVCILIIGEGEAERHIAVGTSQALAKVQGMEDFHSDFVLKD